MAAAARRKPTPPLPPYFLAVDSAAAMACALGWFFIISEMLSGSQLYCRT